MNNDFISSPSFQQYSENWLKKARPNQLPPPGNWRFWLILAGRGFGKTRTGAETIRMWVEQGLCRHIALVGATYSDARHVMVEGESGLLNIYPDLERPKFYATRQQMIWKNGAVARLFSAASYHKLRGPQFDGAWVDELAKFRYLEETWMNLNLALRLGEKPRMIITTTPRHLPLLKELLQDKTGQVHVTRGSTYDNAENLSPFYIDFIKKQYQGQRLAAQEIHGELVETKQGALWTSRLLDDVQVKTVPVDLSRIVIAIDPALTSHEDSDETGIIVAGQGINNCAYVLADLSGHYAPSTWAEIVAHAYDTYKADVVIYEQNVGGDVLRDLIALKNPLIHCRGVSARRSKITRAEPISALYHQKKVYHLSGLGLLEQQLLSYVPGETTKSPDRLDALVWALTALMLNQQPTRPAREHTKVWGCSSQQRKDLHPHLSFHS